MLVSAYVNRIRGYHSQKSRLPGYSDGIINSEYIGPDSIYRRVMKTYQSLKAPYFWAREWPTSWRDIDHDFNQHARPAFRDDQAVKNGEAGASEHKLESLIRNQTIWNDQIELQKAGPPLRVTVAHTPRNDLLGSFVCPTLYLYAVAHTYGWELAVLPFAGSKQEKILQNNFALGDKIDRGWGGGFQDASHRKGYNPVALNTDAIATMGFFPPIFNASENKKIVWIEVEHLASPGRGAGIELEEVCRNRTTADHCYIQLPDNPHTIQRHMEQNGGPDSFFSPELRKTIRNLFLEKNRHRLQHYRDDEKSSSYNIAIHVRRGDIVAPTRWINQEVYATVARRICQQHRNAHVHVFSSGPNKDGNWNALESVAKNGDCASVAFHLDELEFDTWAHMVVADALIISKSAFGEIPALLCSGQVYFPHDFWHVKLSNWIIFNSQNGAFGQ